MNDERTEIHEEWNEYAESSGDEERLGYHDVRDEREVYNSRDQVRTNEEVHVFPREISRLLKAKKLHLVESVNLCFNEIDHFTEACRVLNRHFISYSYDQIDEDFYEVTIHLDGNRVYEELYAVFNNLISCKNKNDERWGYELDLRPKYYSCTVNC
jgi:hypothetical protein